MTTTREAVRTLMESPIYWRMAPWQRRDAVRHYIDTAKRAEKEVAKK